MDMETWQITTPETLNADQWRGIPKERKQEMAQKTQLETESEGDDADKELRMDIQHMEDGPTTKQGKDMSPKRTKKMKVDKSTPQTHDRSRSGTRRALHKGKML